MKIGICRSFICISNCCYFFSFSFSGCYCRFNNDFSDYFCPRSSVATRYLLHIFCVFRLMVNRVMWNEINFPSALHMHAIFHSSDLHFSFRDMIEDKKRLAGAGFGGEKGEEFRDFCSLK